jgi:transposase
MVRNGRRSRLPASIQEELIQHFVAGATARTAADLAGVNRHTATLYFTKLREIIARRVAAETPFLSGEIELDESYFGGQRKGKRGRGATGKVIVFGLLKRGGKVHAIVVPDVKTSTLEPLIKQRVRPDSIVYTDGYKGYDTLDVAGFKHHRVNHSETFVEGAHNHINGIENFWNQAKRHMRRFNGIPKNQFPLFLRECEWRFNYRPTQNLFKVLLAWANTDLL